MMRTDFFADLMNIGANNYQIRDKNLWSGIGMSRHTDEEEENDSIMSIKAHHIILWMEQ